MKIFHSIFLLAASISLLTACVTENKTEKEKESTEQSEVESEHEHSSEELQLNHGEKWKVDDSMMVHLRNMSSSLLTFRLTEHTTHQLADSLQSNIDLLTSNCTMKGAAHDELHKWLIPFIDKVNNFAKVKTENEAAELYKELIKSFDTFYQFFE